MTEGYCYAAESREFYKFGHSHDPSRRVFNLSSQVGETVKLLGYARGSLIQEARLHELLHRHLSHGEWYVKNKITAAVAELFPAHRVVPLAVRDAFAAMRGEQGDKKEASALLRSCFLPGTPMLGQIKFLANELGMSPRRVRAIVGREARLISTREVEAIRQLAEQKTALIAGRRK